MLSTWSLAVFYGLVRTNGMISKKEVSASYRHISLKILEKFPEVLERVSFELGQQKSRDAQPSTPDKKAVTPCTMPYALCALICGEPPP